MQQYYSPTLSVSRCRSSVSEFKKARLASSLHLEGRVIYIYMYSRDVKLFVSRYRAESRPGRPNRGHCSAFGERDRQDRHFLTD